MNIYKIKEEQLRSRPHKEYQEKYNIEEIIPKGLQIPIIPKVNQRREQFETKWRARLRKELN